MKKYFLKISSIVFLAAIFSFGTYKLMYWVGETYFFDKIFYQKSVEHGYWQKGQSYNNFGERVNSISKINNIYKHNYQEIQDFSYLLETKVLGDNTSSFNVVIIGDSYIFGQGLKYEDTVSVILEKKLKNKFAKRQTKVTTLALPGDNIFDAYNKYLWANKLWNPDLFIFAIGWNDLLWRQNNNLYPGPIYKEVEKDCHGDLILDQIINSKDKSSYTNYNELIIKSFEKESKNWCGLIKILDKLNKNKVFFVNINDLDNSHHPSNIKFKKTLQNMSLPFYDIERKWNELKQENTDYESVKFTNSKLEGHHSKVGHEVYAAAIMDIIESRR